MEQLLAAPWYSWVAFVVIVGFIGYRIRESKKRTGTFTGGIFGGSGRKTKVK